LRDKVRKIQFLILSLPSIKSPERRNISTLIEGVKLNDLVNILAEEDQKIFLLNKRYEKIRIWGLNKKYRKMILSLNPDDTIILILKEGGIRPQDIRNEEDLIKRIPEKIKIFGIGIVAKIIENEELARLIYRNKKYSIIMILETFKKLDEKTSTVLLEHICGILNSPKHCKILCQPIPFILNKKVKRNKLSSLIEIVLRILRRSVIEVDPSNIILREIILLATYVAWCKAPKKLEIANPFVDSKVIVKSIQQIFDKMGITINMRTEDLWRILVRFVAYDYAELSKIVQKFRVSDLSGLRLAPTKRGEFKVAFYKARCSKSTIEDTLKRIQELISRLINNS